MINGALAFCSKEEKGYYLGSIQIENCGFHVEAIEVRVISRGSNKGSITATNPAWNERIEEWKSANDYERPQFITKNGKHYFVAIEHFAQ
jgi:hypothetical protein